MNNKQRTGIANPFIEVDSHAAFMEQLSIFLLPPKNAEVIHYHICNQCFCQIDCCINDVQYTLRAQKGGQIDLLAGIYGDWIASNRMSEAQYFRCDSYSIAGWYKGDVCYTVVAEADEETMAGIIEDYIRDKNVVES